MDGFDQSVNVKVCTSLVIVYLCQSTEVIQYCRYVHCTVCIHSVCVAVLDRNPLRILTCYSAELPLRVGLIHS